MITKSAAAVVGATMRGVIATFGTTIYIVVLSNRLAMTTPERVPGALTQAGLPASSIAGFIAAIPTGSCANVPGVSPVIISAGVTAYKHALVLAYRTVFLTTLAFSGTILAMSFAYPGFDNKMPNETTAILRGRKERAKVIQRLEQNTSEPAQKGDSEIEEVESQHIEEKSHVTRVK